MSGVEGSPAFEPDTSCGDCVMCCEWLNIETGEFSKKAGILCSHCTGRGCGIYETRPKICRSFLCGWRVIPALGPDWRPDRSGVMILLVEKNVPPQYDGASTGFNFVVLGGTRAITRPGFAEYLTLLVSRRVAVYFSADSPKTLINEYLAPMAAGRDMEGARKMLLHIYGLHLQQRGIQFPGAVPLPP
ncbi:MAG TPA: hypothetical protein VG501_09595 [Rhizomicrobium sp.]|nr:hypothetical protein [Rhizomicrobium sp.]